MANGAGPERSRLKIVGPLEDPDAPFPYALLVGDRRSGQLLLIAPAGADLCDRAAFVQCPVYEKAPRWDERGGVGPDD